VDRLDRIRSFNEVRIELSNAQWMNLRKSYNQYINAVCPLLSTYNPSSSDLSQFNQFKEVLDKSGSEQDSWIMKLKVSRFWSICYRSHHAKRRGAAVMATNLRPSPFT